MDNSVNKYNGSSIITDYTYKNEYFVQHTKYNSDNKL